MARDRRAGCGAPRAGRLWLDLELKTCGAGGAASLTM